MDNYISKPVSLSELKAKLEQWRSNRFELKDSEYQASQVTKEEGLKDQNSTSQSMNDADSMKPEWDPQTLVRMVGDKEAVHQRLLVKYLRSAEKCISTISVALMEAGMPKVRSAAHDFKSISPMQLGDLCQSLSLACKDGDGEVCKVTAAQVTENN